LGQKRTAYKVFAGKHQRKSHWEELSIDRRITLKWF
jgi:hypothetical protein